MHIHWIRWYELLIGRWLCRILECEGLVMRLGMYVCWYGEMVVGVTRFSRKPQEMWGGYVNGIWEATAINGMLQIGLVPSFLIPRSRSFGPFHTAKEHHKWQVRVVRASQPHTVWFLSSSGVIRYVQLLQPGQLPVLFFGRCLCFPCIEESTITCLELCLYLAGTQSGDVLTCCGIIRTQFNHIAQKRRFECGLCPNHTKFTFRQVAAEKWMSAHHFLLLYYSFGLCWKIDVSPSLFIFYDWGLCCEIDVGPPLFALLHLQMPRDSVIRGQPLMTSSIINISGCDI